MVKNAQYHSRPPSIYPGIYQPIFTREREMVRVKGSKPPVNIMEFPDYYEIEMPAPGFQKDDFFIKTQGWTLLIVGYNNSLANSKEARYHQHGFRCRYLTRTIDLPDDADPEFGTAAYKNGVLYIYLYKTSFPVQNRQNLIIVY